MAHLIDFSNARENMAYVSDQPWHGLGQKLSPDADLDTWIKEAGFDWEINRSPVQFVAPGDEPNLRTIPNRWVLSRSDTKAPLSVVSSNV